MREKDQLRELLVIPVQPEHELLSIEWEIKLFFIPGLNSKDGDTS